MRTPVATVHGSAFRLMLYPAMTHATWEQIIAMRSPPRYEIAVRLRQP
jgi:hypothetical protein